MTPGVGGKKIKWQEKINIRKKCLLLKQLKKHFHRYLKISVIQNFLKILFMARPKMSTNH